jgi:hypothetical protein
LNKRVARAKLECQLLAACRLVMCVVNVQYCPSCRIYSPVGLLSLSESRPRYMLVYDARCQQYFCRRHLQVFTSWAPDPRGQRDEDWLGACCEQCTPLDCRVQLIHRDCCRGSQGCHPSRWLVRKSSQDPWSTPFFSFAHVERSWMGRPIV